jgi:hypothetical protein
VFENRVLRRIFGPKRDEVIRVEKRFFLIPALFASCSNTLSK